MNAYVKADRATFEAVSSDYVKMINESDLDDDKKERRKRLVVSWGKRIKAAEDGEKNE
jgi:hypothetical protein